MFQVKYQADCFMKRFKACLIMQGYLQVYEIDYIKTFILSIRQELLRIFLVIATILRMMVLQLNIIGAYLESLFG